MENTFMLLSREEQIGIVSEKLKTIEAHWFNTSVDIEMARAMNDEKNAGVLIAQQTGLGLQMNRMTEIYNELVNDNEDPAPVDGDQED